MRFSAASVLKYIGRPFSFGLGIGLGLAVCLGVTQRATRFETVEAKRFHVVDGKGNLVAEFGLGAEISDPALVFYDREGNTVAHLLTDEKFPRLVMFGEEDSAAILQIDGSGPHLHIRDKKGNTLGQIPARR